MKAHLLLADRDLDLRRAEVDEAADLTQDLGLDILWNAMAASDPLVGKIARLVMLEGLTKPTEIRYRQGVLDDCLRHESVVRALYDLAGDGLAAEKSVFHSFFADRPERLLERSVSVLELFVEVLNRLRRLGRENSDSFRSDGFRGFFATLEAELDDVYFAAIGEHLKALRFRNGLLLSARLGRGNNGIDYVLRQPREENRTFFNRVGLKKPTFSYTVPDRDEGGMSALSELRDRGLDDVANAAAQSVDHVLSFFQALRSELAFYVGCLNLHARLHASGQPVCFPDPHGTDDGVLTARGLYDAALPLRTDAAVVGNDIDADGRALVVITGANQGGKSTFLRSIALAQLMMQAGLFVGAISFAASTRRGVFTHFKREEDDSMISGKFDEELARMSWIADRIQPGALLLCNESFASTNEREGSEIGREVVHAMVDGGVEVVFVTHLFDLAQGLREEGRASTLFLRAERGDAGHRTFKLVEGPPLPTSFGQDLYARIFGQEIGPKRWRPDGQH